MEDWKIIGPLICGLTVIYGWLFKHASNSKKHPCKDDIVFREVCQANRDCIETKLDGLEKLTKQGFENIENLIKKGS